MNTDNILLPNSAYIALLLTEPFIRPISMAEGRDNFGYKEDDYCPNWTSQDQNGFQPASRVRFFDTR